MGHQYSHASVVRVIDGDSVEVDIDHGFGWRNTAQVRLAGIDAPETRDPGPEGEAARDWLKALLPAGTAIQLFTEKPKDKHGRYLATMWRHGDVTSVNKQLLDAGHAKPYGGGQRG